MGVVGRRTAQALALVLVLGVFAQGAGAEPDEAAPLRARSLAQLELFTDWLAAGKAKGFVGEVGWPGNPEAAGDLRWNRIAQAWYREADRAGLWVAAWASGEIWHSSYKLLVYRAPDQYQPVGVANPQAAVIESQPRPRLRGVNVDQGAFAFDSVAPTSPLHNRNLGAYGVAYSYPGPATFRFLASRGVTFVRIPFRWERLQRDLGGPLDATELERLAASVRAAGEAGLQVVLDCHNYGGYYLFGQRAAIGSPQLPVRAFADLWRRLSLAFGSERGVLGYTLMNEPAEMGSAAAWEAASRAAVAAVRSTGDRKRIFVSSYHWGGMWQFPYYHPRGPWIADPARNTWYEAHMYFDADLTARYLASFEQEIELARAQGH
jgi:hypothetical protein